MHFFNMEKKRRTKLFRRNLDGLKVTEENLKWIYV